MNLLAEIYRREGLNIHGTLSQRTAVRAVTLHDKEILMIHSPEVGDYKFPGGGVQPGETHEQALRREVQEECGMRLTEIRSEIGVVVEYNSSIEPEFDAFKMTSYYYSCRLEDGSGKQQLDEYEERLHFKPVWINIDKAIWLNKQVLRFGKAPGWLRRELFVLEYIRRDLPRGPMT